MNKPLLELFGVVIVCVLVGLGACEFIEHLPPAPCEATNSC